MIKMESNYLKIIADDSWKNHTLSELNLMPILKEGLAIINKSKLNAIIGGKTLLGFYRDKGFIPHDTDVNVDLFIEELNSKPTLMALINAFETNKFKLIKTQQYQDKPMQIAFTKNDVIFDIYLYYQLNSKDFLNINEYGLLFYPHYFLTSLKKLSVMGETFYIPSKTELYLSERYTEWKMPPDHKESWEKDAGCLLLKL
jgi:hypothetical protein